MSSVGQTPPTLVPRLLVIMATFNGSRWIETQLRSIFEQAGVQVSLAVRDDASTDATAAVLQSFGQHHKAFVEFATASGGSAAANFFRLMQTVDVSECDYVALSDQDDVWHPGKLARAVSCLRQSGAAGYSAAVQAFWPDGKTAVLRQDPGLTQGDYIFEGAGQGCTFVLDASFFRVVQTFLLSHPSLLASIQYHDWTIYALCRSLGCGWFFDQEISMQYRQHSTNDTGARSGLRAKVRRIALIRSGWYGNQVHAMARLCAIASPGDASPANTYLQLRRDAMSAAAGRLNLCRFALKAGRRRFADRLVLALRHSAATCPFQRAAGEENVPYEVRRAHVSWHIRRQVLLDLRSRNGKMTRDQLATLIAARLTQELSACKTQWTQSGAIQHCFVDNLLPEELTASIYSHYPEGARMRTLKTIREFKHIAAQMDQYDPILEEALFAFQDPRVVDLVGQITGLRALQPDAQLYAGGISMMSKGHFLNPHIDNSHDRDRSRYRVLNLLFYVTPDWKKSNGGNLELWPEGIEGQQITIESKFNRLALMVTHQGSWHSVSPVLVDAKRCCVSNYYFSEQPAEENEYFHVTSYRGRPEQPVRDLVLQADASLRMGIRKVFAKGIRKNPTFTTKNKYAVDVDWCLKGMLTTSTCRQYAPLRLNITPTVFMTIMKSEKTPQPRT